MSSNKYPPPWENHTHYWVCHKGFWDYCNDCGRKATFNDYRKSIESHG